MSFIFPVSKQHSPVTATLYTFLGPVIYGAVAGATTALVVDYMMAGVDMGRWKFASWGPPLGVVVLVGTVYAQFRQVRSTFEANEEYTLEEVLRPLWTLPVYFAVIAAIGCGSYPLYRTRIPAALESWGYPGFANTIQYFPGILALFTASLAVLFIAVLRNNYQEGRATRGEKIGSIASIRQMLAKRRKGRDKQREDDILAQIHRDGGTSKLPKDDLDFLKQRASKARWQRN